MAWLWAALTPHPPIIVPDVGNGREREAGVTLKGIADLMERLKSREAPDRILLLSPHQPYVPGAFAINGEKRIKGGLAPFGSRVAFDFAPPGGAVDALLKHLGAKGVFVNVTRGADLSRDQGAAVPLFFLERAFGKLPGVVLSSPIGLDRAESLKLGAALASFDDGFAWGLLASGDLSHRLKPGAPAGFSPMGERFDEAVVESLKGRDASPVLDMPEHAIDEAGECGMRSVLTMIGLAGALRGTIDVLSYEGPFGVGYCNAVSIFAKE
jgi:aromatic ring-opening dioxygenase LigB subunit